MDDLIEFLRARYDEAVAPRAEDTWHEPWCLDPSSLNADGNCFYCGEKPDPAKVKYVSPPDGVLRDIESKRAILDLHDETENAEGRDENDESTNGFISGLWHAARLLAVPYAVHPDYRPEWAPTA